MDSIDTFAVHKSLQNFSSLGGSVLKADYDVHFEQHIDRVHIGLLDKKKEIIFMMRNSGALLRTFRVFRRCCHELMIH